MSSLIRDDNLTRGQLEGLLVRLDPDRNRAGETYEDIRRKLIRFFRWNDCRGGEDLADDTLDRVAQRLASVEVRDVLAFLWGVARNVVREAGRRPREIDVAALPLGKEPHTGDAESHIVNEKEKERRLQCLHECIQKLPAVDRELLLHYQHCMNERQGTQSLAARFGLTVGALRTRVHRLRHKIEVCSLRRVERRLAVSSGRDRLRLGIVDPCLGVPPSLRPGGIPRFESEVDVHGRLPVDPNLALQSLVYGYDLRYGPGGGAPGRRELSEQRPHATEGANVLPVLGSLYKKIRKK